MKYILLLIFIIFTILGGYAFWYKSNHASVSVGLKFKEKDKKLMPLLLNKAQIILLDKNSNELAKGIYNGNYRQVHLLNPIIINIDKCSDVIEKKKISYDSMYHDCFNYSKTWASKWVDELEYIQIEHPKCMSLEIPIDIRQSNAGFFGLFFWWFPMPHGGSGPPSDKYHHGFPLIEKNDCVDLTGKTRKQTKGVRKIVLSDNDQVRAKLALRFKGKLDFVGQFLNKNWDVGLVEGKKVWLEKEYDLLWSEKLVETIDSWGSKADREKAEILCNKLKPTGHWGLPTQAEYVLSKRNGMGQVVENLDGKWLSQMVSQGSKHISGSPITFKASRAKVSFIRCVAITGKAPNHGYFSSDFPLNYISSIIMDEMAESGRRYKKAQKLKRKNN
ncbi:MAG: hypothetical protein L3J83_05280 [Proteobacteria bacterium]|nr:hypothetical protein [Pseudomonadota bacterium]